MKEKQFLEVLVNYKEIFIYGAGMVGELVYKRLVANGLDTNIKGFVVTHKSSSTSYYLEQSIFEIDELKENKEEIVFIIATMPDLHQEIREKLVEHGYSHIVEVDKFLYEDLAKEYIKEFWNNEEKSEGRIDVIFMASDNNSSSGAFLSMTDLNYELNLRNIKTLVVLPEYGNGEKILLEKGIEYTYIPSEHWAIPIGTDLSDEKRRKIEANNIAVEQLCLLIRKHQVKIVHNNTIYTYIGAIAAKREEIRCVWHIRENIEWQKNRFIDKSRAFQCVNGADRIVIVSQYIQKLLRGLDEKKGIVAYDVIDVDNFYMEREICENQQEIIITLSGALTEFKRQEDLIRAAGYLKKKGYSGFGIRLVGKGDQKYIQRLRGLAEELGVQEYVRFLGRCDNMRTIYADTDIVVVCSVEPLGRVTLEGQLSGSLVIGANVGATVELIEDGETGLLYQYKDPESLARCIGDMIVHPERARDIARRGREYARITYAKEKSVGEIIKMYEELKENAQ